jgi:choline dehydrogenase
MVYDYIIVGAGSAGCVLANRLTEDPSCNVLLLEAGGKGNFLVTIPGAYSVLHRSAVDWAFWTEPQTQVLNRQLFIPRGKVLGGSSSTNAMAYVRGNAADYDEWSSLGNKGWSYKEVLPYFIKSEHHQSKGAPWHGTNGPLYVSFASNPSPLNQFFLEACGKNGIPFNEDYNGGSQVGASMLQYTIRDNRRQSTAKAFLLPAMKRPNLEVRTNATVKQVLIEQNRVTGIELVTGKSTTEKIRCTKEVILSAGTIKSPHLLQLSGIGYKDMLKNAGVPMKHHLPGVGQNLQDHVWTHVSNLCITATNNAVISPIKQLKGLLQYSLFKKGPFCNSVIESNAFLHTENRMDRPDIQFHFSPGHAGDDYMGDIYDLKTLPRTNGFTILVILIRPESKGFVALHTDNPLNAPMIQPNIFHSETDRNKLLAGLKKAMAVADDDCFRIHSPDGLNHPKRNSTDEQLMQHIYKSLETLYHPVGTCKMGSDQMAVVNERLQLHGMAGLRVVDASIMPTIISGNTNAASIMIGEKGADLIKADR